MKQSADLRPVLDLDDIERQLQAAVDSRKQYSDDPLAELARIVKNDDPLRSSETAQRDATPSLSFDDFLKTPPRPASGVMPQHTPAVEPLFPDDEVSVQSVSERFAERVAPVWPETSSGSDVSHELSLEESSEPSLVPGVVAQAGHPSDAAPDVDVFQNDFDLRLEQALAGADVSDLNNRVDEVGVDRPALETLSAGLDSVAPAPKAPFDDMLAEFEAAMRDAGGELATQPAAQSLEPVLVPPPPPERIAPDVDTGNTGRGLSGLSGGAAALGAGAAGVAVIAAGAVAAGASQTAAVSNSSVPKKLAFKSRGLMIAAGVVGVAVIGMGSLLGFGSGLRKAAPVNAPVIAAKPGVTKERPANPGGVEVPNQDKEVLQSKPPTAAVERVVPREEQPVDLAAAQRRVLATPEAPPAGAPAVRQIPGVAIVAPISIVPPGTAATSAEPAPRPVASVPITIAGQPPTAIQSPIPTQPAPVAPSVTAPVVTTPSTAPAVRAPAATPPAATAEPRRVRAVPIRADGESAPARAQTQPRIVPAAPGVQPAAEPDAANAPLRITPAANRAAPQRVASAPPAQEAPAARTGSTGGGFAVQLAAEGSSDSARSKFNRIRGQHSSVLGNYQPDIRSAEVNGRSVYRVRVGDLSREEAVSVCERLKANGGTCFVARN